MPLFTAVIADHLHDHAGVTSDTELLALGCTRSRIHALVDAKILIPVHRGVYRLRSSPWTLEAKCRAICLASRDAVITGRAAGVLWGVRRVGHPETVEVRAPHSSNSFTADWITVRRCPPLDPVDITEREDGIRVVSPPRLVFDLSAVLDDLDLESVIEQVIDKGWCTLETIRDTGARLFHTSRPGSRRFARVIASRPAWSKPADSHLEVMLMHALRAAGVDGLVRQFPLDLPGGFRIHADLAVPPLRWIIPIDHVTWHGGRIDAQRDKQTDRQVRMIGWHVDRVTDDDIERHLDAVVAELLAIRSRLAARSAS